MKPPRLWEGVYFGSGGFGPRAVEGIPIGAGATAIREGGERPNLVRTLKELGWGETPTAVVFPPAGADWLLAWINVYGFDL